MSTQPQCEAAAPAVVLAPICPGAPAGFPAYSVKHGIAQIELRAKNGYVHRFRVDATDIPFLQLCWPFEVSTGGKRKKVIRRIGSRQVLLHTLWLAYYRHNLPSHRGFSRVPKCRNKNWLDWTQDNIYLPEVNQEAESRREAYLSNRLTEAAKELLYTRMCGLSYSIPSNDPEIVWAFQDAARMPARSVRPRNRGPDLFTKPDDD
jgi:hypothetical protein